MSTPSIPPPDLTDEPPEVRDAVRAIVLERDLRERERLLARVPGPIRRRVNDLLVADFVAGIIRAPARETRRWLLSRVPLALRGDVERQARRVWRGQ